MVGTGSKKAGSRRGRKKIGRRRIVTSVLHLAETGMSPEGFYEVRLDKIKNEDMIK